MVTTPARAAAKESILDAAEALLVETGAAAITTRRLAERAEVNQGLIHYYFGAMEEVFLQVLERSTARLTERQRQLYAADVPFIEKWRAAMHHLVDPDELRYQKMWFELQAMAWNHPEMRARVARIHGEWMRVLEPAFRDGLRELGIDTRRYPPDAIVSLVATFNQGVMLERLLGIDSGHDALLKMIDRMLVRASREHTTRSRS